MTQPQTFPVLQTVRVGSFLLALTLLFVPLLFFLCLRQWNFDQYHQMSPVLSN